MRPDIEEFEDLNEADDAPRSRAMSWLVLAVAVSGFIALAYYAYHSGNKAGAEGDLMVVQADESPIKQLPEEAGGEQFPNKDKTIYDAIAPAGERQVEKLLPEPENPVAAALRNTSTAEDDGDVDGAAPQAAQQAAAPVTTTTTFVNKNPNAQPTTDPVDAQAAKQPAPAKAPEAKVVAAAPAPAATPAATPVPAPVAKAPEPAAPVTSAAEPNFVNEKPATPVKAAAAVKEEKPASAKPAPAKPAAPKVAAGGGAYKVQLGAFQSEAEAMGQWKKITAKFPGLVIGSPIVVKAELPNGTFYRLRASGYASADAAKATCAAMSAKGQACFPAGK